MILSHFHKLGREHLLPTASIPQCLDNHWLPNAHLFGRQSLVGHKQTLLDRLLRRRKPRNVEEWQADIARFKRAEYIRSLITTEQIIVNRAFFVGLPTIYEDYIPSSDQFEEFQSLLNDGALVVYLALEEEPIDIATASFPRNQQASDAWRRLCLDSTPHCIRLSWDANDNKGKIENHLGRQFATRLLALHVGNPEQFLRDLRGVNSRLEPDEVRAFKARLVDVRNAVSDIHDRSGGHIKRTDIYTRFVQESGARLEEQRYDHRKKFFAEIKQLTDLIYNTNLSNALQAFTCTPTDSPTRLVLQELQTAAGLGKSASGYLRGVDLGALVSDLRFGVIHQALNFVDFGALSLGDVVKIRATEEWKDYVKVLARVVKNDSLLDSLDSASSDEAGLVALERAYYALLRVIVGRFVQATVQTDTLKPVVKILIEAGSEFVILDYVGASDPIAKIGSKVANSTVSDAAADVIVSWNIGWISAATEEFLNAGTVQLARRRFRNAREDWGALKEAIVRTASSGKANHVEEAAAPTLNQALELGWDVW